MVLPGQLFAYYDWGGTYDPILPALTDRPVAVRSIVPYANLRAVDLQWTTDALVQPAPRRARPAAAAARPDGRRGGRPGQRRRPLPKRGRAGRRAPRRSSTRSGRRRRRMGRCGCSRRDRDARAGRAAARGAPVPRADRRDGASAAAGRSHGRGRLGAVRRAASPASAPCGPTGRCATPPTSTPPRCARCRRRRRVRDRRLQPPPRVRLLAPARRRGLDGPGGGAVLGGRGAARPLPGSRDRRPDRRGGGRRGVRARADFSPGFAQFPERRPFAALDGDPSTAWLADRALARDRHRLEIRFTAPRDVDHVDLMPYSDGRGRVERVAINGRERAVRPGWNRLALGLRGVRALDVRIARVRRPREGEAGAGGIRELRIPGVRATEPLRPPVLAERALRGADLRRAALTYLFDRTTGDDPYRPRVVTADRSRGLVRDQQDGERGWTRLVAPPAAAPGGPTRGSAWRPSARPRHRPLGRHARHDGLRRLDALRGARAQPRLVGVRRRPAAGVDRRLGADGRRGVASVAHARAADGALAAPGACSRPGALPHARARPRGRPGERAAGGRGRRDRRAAPPAARPHGAHRDPRRRLPAGHERPGPPAPRRRRGRDQRQWGPARGGRPPRAACDRVRCGAAPARGRVGAAPARHRLRRAARRRAAAARPCVRRRRRAPGRAAHGARPGGAVAAGPRAPRVAGARSRRSAGGRRPRSRRGHRRPRSARRRAAGRRRPVVARARRVLRRGWRARCDGRSLGRPVPIQGFANGWPVDRGCRRASFAFAPNRALLAGDAISLVACLAAPGVAGRPAPTAR